MAVFLFFDESGNLDFSSNGTPQYIFGVLTTRSPIAFTERFSQLRYELLAASTELEAFHASEDRQGVRDNVFRAIAEIGGFEFDCAVITKSSVQGDLREPSRFYPTFAQPLLKCVFERYRSSDEPIVVITDTIPVKQKREAVKKAFKAFIRKELGGREFSVLHHSSAGHSALQAADYCTWAIHKKYKGEMRPFSTIKRFVKSELLLPIDTNRAGL